MDSLNKQNPLVVSTTKTDLPEASNRLRLVRCTDVTLNKVINDCVATGEITEDACCSAHASCPYYIYVRETLAVLRTPQTAYLCRMEGLNFKTMSHCVTYYDGWRATTAAFVFGHLELFELMQIPNAKPRRTARLRFCAFTCTGCSMHRDQCLCEPSCVTSSSDNDESEDASDRNENTGVGLFPYMTLVRLARKLPMPARFQSDTQSATGIFHDIQVFVSSCARTIVGMPARLVKSVIRSVLGYVVEVIAEYFPSHLSGHLKYFGLLIVYMAFRSTGICAAISWCLMAVFAHLVQASFTTKAALCLTAALDIHACEHVAQSGATSFVTKVMTVVAALTAVKFLPSTTDFSLFLRKCDQFPKALNGLDKLSDYISQFWSFAEKQLAASMGWEQGFDSEIPQDVDANFLAVTECASLESRKRIPTDEFLRERISELYRDFFKLRRIHHASRTVMQYMDKYYGLIGTLMTLVSNATLGETPNRPKPVVVFFRGGTGVGKSELLYFLGADILCDLGILDASMDDEEIESKVSTCMYARYVEQDFWDNYARQKICLYDDFGQMCDGKANPNLEFMEMIRAGNRFPYALHMASLDKKDATMFSSEYILATTNLKSINPVSIVDPAAVRSRIDFGWLVTVKKQYQVNPNGESEEDHRIDREKVKCFDGPSVEVYNFNKWDPITGSLYGKAYTYQEVRDSLLEKHRDYILAHKKSANVITKHVRKNLLQARQQSKMAPEVVGDGLCRDAQDVYDALVVPDAPTSTSWLKRFGLWSSDPKVEPVPEPTTWYQNFLEASLFREKCASVMKSVWTRIGNAFSQYATWWAILALVLLLLWGNKSNSGVDAEYALMKRYVETTKHEDNYVKVTRCIPKRLRKMMPNDPGNGEPIFNAGDAPVAVMSFYGTFAEKLEASKKYEEDLEKFMTMTEWTSYVESGFLPPSVMDRLALDYTVPEKGQEESGRNLPNKLVAAVESASMEANEQAYGSKQAREIVNVVRYNHYYLSWPGKSCLVLGIGGRAFLVNRHFWEQAPEGTLTLQGCYAKSRIEIAKNEILIEQLDRPGEIGDMLMMRMPIRVAQVADIRRHFVRRKDLAAMVGTFGILVTQEEKVNATRSGKITEHRLKDVLLSGKPKRLMTIVSDIRTIEGDCGGVMVLDDDRFVGKMCGFHYGGAWSGGALSIPLVYEDFEKYGDLNTLVKPKLVKPNVEQPIFAHGQCVGSVEVAPSNPVRTSFERTALFGNEHLEPSEMAPAYLAPMERVDGPAMKALKKVDQDVPLLSKYKLGLAAESFKTVLFPWRGKAPDRRILTFEEAVQGCELPFAKGINRAHSAGYPWMLKSSKGKRHWFGSNDWDVTGEAALEVKGEVERKIALMRNGQYEPALYVDTLKDETRDLERVALQKTRVFSAAPMDYIIIMRMYFLAFFSFVMVNRNENEISVGTQCQSIDWHMMTERLLSNNGGIVAGDFSNFDGTLHSEILYKVLSIIQDWYDDGPENQQIRALIFEDVVHSWHVTGKEVNTWNHSQPSGNPGTAIFNSMYNSLIMRMCYYDLEEVHSHHVEHLDTFNRNVRMVSYGDDNLLSVAQSATWYNQTAITSAMEKYGMVYTSETKDGSQHVFRGIGEVSYLQRSFRFEPKISMWVAPLKKRSINERMYWMKKNPTPHAVLLENCRGAIAEWALHSNEDFELWQHKITCAMATLGGEYEPWKPQTYFLEHVRTGDYGAAFPATSFA